MSGEHERGRDGERTSTSDPAVVTVWSREVLMDLVEAARRDRALRSHFEELEPGGEEARLEKQLVLASTELLPQFPFLVAHQWEPVPGWPQGGKGDLLFFGEPGYAVVEVKFIDLGPGPTRKKRRNQKRGYVRKQALRYASTLEGHPVSAFVYTNEDRLPVFVPVATIR